MSIFVLSPARARLLSCSLALGLAGASPVFAQQQTSEDHSAHEATPMQMQDSKMDHSTMGHSQMDHSQMGHAQHEGMSTPTRPAKTTAGQKKKAAGSKPGAMPGMNHSAHSSAHAGEAHQDTMHHGMTMDGGAQSESHDGMHPGDHMGMHMPAFLGPYPGTREGSGTSWVPDTTPHEGVHGQYGDWTTMYHGMVNLVYDHQGGPRGGDKTFAPGMIMGMARRETADGAIGLRAMLSPDPFMGPNGYPLLLATGETANGKTHLVDRQHPHDLFMELAATYSHNLSKDSSLFIYGGLPGEPALGPPAFMHRTSGMDIPAAPITHHWLDSTHITFGVITAGLIVDRWKIEGSAFRGREPDQYRYDIEVPKLDSSAVRVSWNPTDEWSAQVSYGHLVAPEQLEPGVNEDRITASAIYTTRVFGDNTWSTTFAWGRKMLAPGPTLDGFLLESALIMKNGVTLFARGERVRENELVEAADIASIGLTSPLFTVGKLTGGGIYDFYRTEHAKFGVGALVSTYDLPRELRHFYGDPTSAMVFLRLKVI